MNIILTFIYMGIVFILSVIKVPGGADPFPGFDKVVHFSIYGLMGILWARVFFSARSSRLRVTPRRVIIKVLAVTFFYGLFIEFVQGFLPARDASFFDALANGAGGGIGASVYCLLKRYISRS